MHRLRAYVATSWLAFILPILNYAAWFLIVLAVGPRTTSGHPLANAAILSIFGLYLINIAWHILLLLFRRPSMVMAGYGVVSACAGFFWGLYCACMISHDC